MNNNVFIQPIPCRSEFSKCINDISKNPKDLKAVEIGVWHGLFAKHNCENYEGIYYCVDPYKYIKSNENDKNYKDENVNNKNFNIAKQNLSIFGDRINFIRKESNEAVKLFDDNSLDWIYIDASHKYDNVLEDLENWYPKLKKGGLMSGDDYGSINLKYVNENMWKNSISSDFYYHVKKHNFGVADAVNNFCKKKNINVSVTWLNNKPHNVTPNWYFIK